MGDLDSAASRWGHFFEDLDAQFAYGRAASEAQEVEERLRHEAGQRTLVERLRAAVGGTVRIGLQQREPMRLEVHEIGADWFVGADGADYLVPLQNVLWIEGLSRRADATEPGRVWDAYDLRKLVRQLARQRARVALPAVRSVAAPGDGSGWDEGTFDRVYADHVDFACVPSGEPRRDSAVQSIRAVPLRALVLIRRLS